MHFYTYIFYIVSARRYLWYLLKELLHDYVFVNDLTHCNFILEV